MYALPAAILLIAAALTGARAAEPPVLRFAIDQDYYPEKQTPQRVAQDFALVHALSIKILRTGIGWDDTNPAPGVFAWQYWTDVARRARRTGIMLQPYYAYTPAWAGHAYNSPPRDDASFATACGVMARRMAPFAPAIEVWNEPDNTAFWTGTPAQYGSLLHDCSAAIGRSRPDLAVVLGGLVYLDDAWLRRTGAVAGQDFSIAAFHQYTETPWDSTTVEQVSDPAYYWPLYERLSGRAQLPVWMDEGGATTAAAQGYGQVSQASWIRRTVASLIGQARHPLALFGLYQLRDPDPRLGHPIGDKQARVFFRHTGLFTLDGRPKLGALAYADLVRLFDGHRPMVQEGISYTPDRGRVSHAFRLYAWQLDHGDPAHQAVMIWDRRESTSGTIALLHPARVALLHRADGSIEPVAHFNGHSLHIARLAAGALPLLFECR